MGMVMRQDILIGNVYSMSELMTVMGLSCGVVV